METGGKEIVGLVAGLLSAFEWFGSPRSIPVPSQSMSGTRRKAIAATWRSLRAAPGPTVWSDKPCTGSVANEETPRGAGVIGSQLPMTDRGVFLRMCG
jgi:hypothetical protein